MFLTPYGLRVWFPITIVAAIVTAALMWLHWWWPLGVVIALWLALMSFFRDPWRPLPDGLSDGDMLSPADGAVTAVFDVESHEATGGSPARIIRIFLSVLNVHINRSPCDGEVVSLKYTEGRFLNAQTEESATVNGANLIVVRIASGETIGVRQVAGMIARAIVCPLKPGDRLKRGEKFGMIKFGSTTELILPRPQDVTAYVKKGDAVKGGKTVIATLKPALAANEGK